MTASELLAFLQEHDLLDTLRSSLVVETEERLLPYGDGDSVITATVTLAGVVVSTESTHLGVVYG